MKHLCIDVGATNTLIGVGERDFRSVISLKTEKFLDDPASVFQHIDLGEVSRASIANPGPLDKENGVVYPPNIDRDRVEIKDLLGDILDEFFLMNDCTAGVVGEYVHGDHVSSDMVYLTVSTGIGGGVISDGRLLEGSGGNFGEVGHFVVGGERKCSCGGEGHWEAYCSGMNLPEVAEEITGEDFDDAKAVFQAYEEGTDGVEKVIDLMRSYNVKGIANVVNAYDPELIVFGGPVALNNFEVVVKGLEEEIGEETLTSVPEMRPASLGNRSVLYGLLALCRSQDGTFSSLRELR